MKIIGILPHIFDGKRSFGENLRVFPWGFAQVLSSLERDGHDIEVMDVYGHDLMYDDVRRCLDETTFDAVCISSFASMNYYYTQWISKEIRKRSKSPIIIGGLMANLHHDLLMKREIADFCVIGDGEETAVELFRNLDNPTKVPGVVYPYKDGFHFTGHRQNLTDLDRVPIPNFNLFDLGPYLKSMMFIHAATARYEDFSLKNPVDPSDLFPNFSLLAGRGCPYRCKFCSRSDDTLRLKSVDRIIEEICLLKDKYGIKAVQFKDELLVINKKRTRELCDKIKKLGIYWECQSRINTIDRDILEMISDAGCITVGFGVESGSDKMLRKMNKGITRNQSIRILREAKEVGIHLKLQFMCGYPGETKETLAETAALFGEVGLPPRRLAWTTPMPGSELYDEAMADGLIPDEEQYILDLRKGWNKPGRILLNVSGHSNEEMLKLFDWVHLQAEKNYLSHLIKKPFNWFLPELWDKLVLYFIAKEIYHTSGTDINPDKAILAYRMGWFAHKAALVLSGLKKRDYDMDELRKKKNFHLVLFYKS